MQQKDVWKYCYWLEEKRFNTFQEEMKAQGLEMRRAEKNPCEALLDDIGYAAPDCWGPFAALTRNPGLKPRLLQAKPWLYPHNHLARTMMTA
jgi:hypothetical protein